MKTTLKSTGFKLDNTLRSYTERKIINPVRKLFGKDRLYASLILDVEIGRLTAHHKKGRIWRAEANLTVPGSFFRSEAEADDVRTAIDLVKDEIVGEIKKFKNKKIDRMRRNARKFKGEVKFDPAALVKNPI